MNNELGHQHRYQLRNIEKGCSRIPNLQSTLNDFGSERGDPGERGLRRPQPFLGRLAPAGSAANGDPPAATVVPGPLQEVLGPPLPARGGRLLSLGDVALQLLGLLQGPLVPGDNAGLNPGNGTLLNAV